MHARELMTKDVVTVTQQQFCDAAAAIMLNEGVGSVPVLDDARRVVGIVTDRDLCLAAYKKHLHLSDIPLEDVMSESVVCAGEGDDLTVVEQLMQANQVRRIPVIDDDGRLCGIIAVADIARLRGVSGDVVTEDEIADTISALSQPAL